MVKPFILVFLLLGATLAFAGEESFYPIETLASPQGVSFEVSGLDTLPDGRVAITLRKGELWLLDDSGETPTYKRVAEALHEPLGVLWHNHSYYVAQRGELSRLIDCDGDDVIDEYRTITEDWGLTGNYHEYAYGPKLDLNGNLWITLNQTIGKKIEKDNRWRGWGVTVDEHGNLTPECCGMRSPCGLGTNATGEMFFTDQQGNWVPAGTLHQLKRGAFYGHTDSLEHCDREGSPMKKPEKVEANIPIPEAKEKNPFLSLPAVWFPYRKAGMSATDIACDTTGGAFGPFQDQMFVGDFTEAKIHRVFLEKVRSEYQGACFPFRSGFQSAVVRMTWGKDGCLYVGETNRGWNSIGTASYGLQKVSWNGETPFEIKEMRTKPNGFLLTFTQPLDPASAGNPESYRMSSYTYEYHPQYGSDEIDTNQLKVLSVELKPDRRSALLEVEGLRRYYVHELHAEGVRSEGGEPLLHPEAYYTLNNLSP
ncbi:MAG: hypothetical protein H6751_04935 [Candidatus Omnitrophica bacterium]|nr:hypothetical protein [Candidatus Omnitrophota bacterium]